MIPAVGLVYLVSSPLAKLIPPIFGWSHHHGMKLDWPMIRWSNDPTIEGAISLGRFRFPSGQMPLRIQQERSNPQIFPLGSMMHLSIFPSFPLAHLFFTIFLPKWSDSLFQIRIYGSARNFVERSGAQGLGLRVPETIRWRAGHEALGRGLQSHRHAWWQEPGGGAV